MIYKLDLPNEPVFERTKIYVIRCKDEAVPGCYIGATTDFGARLSQHKHAATAATNPGGENRKLYCTIRANGGWSNYTMSPIESYPECRSLKESRMREREIFEQYGGALNTYRPYITDEERTANHRAADATWRATHKEHIHAYERRRYAAQKSQPAKAATTTVKTTTTTTITTTETTTTNGAPPILGE